MMFETLSELTQKLATNKNMCVMSILTIRTFKKHHADQDYQFYFKWIYTCQFSIYTQYMNALLYTVASINMEHMRKCHSCVVVMVETTARMKPKIDTEWTTGKLPDLSAVLE